MGQKTTNNIEGLSKSKQQQARRKGRQLQVLHRKVLGQTVREIAESTGFSEATLWKDIKDLRNQGIDKDLIERERNIHIKALPMATAVLFAHLMLGDKEVAIGMQKGLRVWTDKLEVIAKVAPDDQQKKMMKNMEALLKLSSDKVKVALPEKTKEEGNLAMVEGGKFVGYDDKPEKPEYTAKGVRDLVEFEKKIKAEAETKETETQSQQDSGKVDYRSATIEPAPKEPKEYQPTHMKVNPGCTCPSEHGHISMLNDPKCPVHGDKDKARDKESSYLSDCTCPSGRRNPECPYHRYYDRVNEGKE